MAERPILFSAPMVRAILAGTKTQTRRAMKPQPHHVDGGVPFGNGPAWAHAEPGTAMIRCPYGKRGDRLWVREAWRTVADANDIAPRDLMNVESFTHYEADGAKPAGMGKLRPGMFMPRWASRITLEITGVRVERLQDISEDDARAEGCAPAWLDADDNETVHVRAQPTYRQGFARLWRDINGADSWGANPWCWVVEFKRVTP
jgi:hypothetical protein